MLMRILFGGFLGSLMANPVFWQVVLVWTFVFKGADIIAGLINTLTDIKWGEILYSPFPLYPLKTKQFNTHQKSS